MVNKTFVKSHSPASENYLLALSSDDKEDMDEDGSMTIQYSLGLISESAWVVLKNRCAIESLKPQCKNFGEQVYLLHRQLLI